jgi:hypothetical protein
MGLESGELRGTLTITVLNRHYAHRLSQKRVQSPLQASPLSPFSFLVSMLPEVHCRSFDFKLPLEEIVIRRST